MGSSLIISIHSEYVRKIISGIKCYEYRKKAPKRHVDYLVLCTTGSHGQINGIVKVKGILNAAPAALWAVTKDHSGLDYNNFLDYYKGCARGTAFCIGSVWIPDGETFLSKLGINKAPQSMQYIDTLHVESMLMNSSCISSDVSGHLLLKRRRSINSTAVASVVINDCRFDHYFPITPPKEANLEASTLLSTMKIENARQSEHSPLRAGEGILVYQ
jgi:predicted transcriptional regulator